MADEKNSTLVGYQTREIRITGERVANMVGLTIRVSRYEQSIIQMSMSGSPNLRSRVKASSDRFNRAVENFEAELREAEKELDMANRRSPRQGERRADGQRPQQTAQSTTKAPAQQQQAKGGDQKHGQQAQSKQANEPKAYPQPKVEQQPQQKASNPQLGQQAQSKQANEQKAPSQANGEQQPEQQPEQKASPQQQASKEGQQQRAHEPAPSEAHQEIESSIESAPVLA